MDFGAKHNLFRSLQALGCQITVVSAHATAAEILKYRPDGVFLSNGPGDPAMATYAVQTIKDLLGKTPIFGVCMGHQLLSLAVGAKTYKLKFGHRGGNQPVLDLTTQKVEISSQNHGYAVDDKSLPAHAKVTHINLNDKTVEGIEIPSLKAFSVQYHPEACPGPHDSQYLFQRFIDWMKENSRS
jgi:carbamoyl-phosphate synthase small subunit